MAVAKAAVKTAIKTATKAATKTVSKSKKLNPTGGKVAKPAGKALARAVTQPKGAIQNQAAKAKSGKVVQPTSKAAPAKGGKLASTLKTIFNSAVSSTKAKAAPAAKPASKPASTAAKSKPAPPAAAKVAAQPTSAKAKPAVAALAPQKAAKAGAGKAGAGKTAQAVAQSQKPAKAAVVASPASALVANAKSAVKRAVGRAGASPTAHGAALEGVCREVACENLATTGGYCRLHYIKNWKKIKRKESILKEGRLNQYIEELVSKYPDKYIEAIRQDLSSIKEFLKVISDLDLDEGTDEFEGEGGEQVEGIIDNIRREFEDEGETF
jgi:hypothetical protein